MGANIGIKYWKTGIGRVENVSRTPSFCKAAGWLLDTVQPGAEAHKYKIRAAYIQTLRRKAASGRRPLKALWRAENAACRNLLIANALQNRPFWSLKQAVLRCETGRFASQNGLFWKTGRSPPLSGMALAAIPGRQNRPPEWLQPKHIYAGRASRRPLPTGETGEGLLRVSPSPACPNTSRSCRGRPRRRRECPRPRARR